MFTIGVFAIIFDDNDRILFCHRTDYDLWNLPGGRLKKGEDPWEGIIREVKEETGFDVKVEKITGIYSKPRENDLVIQFICKITGGKIKINSEADKIKYFAFKNIPRNTVPKHIERIKDFFDNPDKFYMKKQTGQRVRDLIEKGLL